MKMHGGPTSFKGLIPNALTSDNSWPLSDSLETCRENTTSTRAAIRNLVTWLLDYQLESSVLYVAQHVQSLIAGRSAPRGRDGQLMARSTPPTLTCEVIAISPFFHPGSEY